MISVRIEAKTAFALLILLAAFWTQPAEAAADDWRGDLTAISPGEWSREHAAHLLERAGFGGTPEQIDRLAAAGPQRAVSFLVDYELVPNDLLAPFESSQSAIDRLSEVVRETALQRQAADSMEMQPSMEMQAMEMASVDAAQLNQAARTALRQVDNHEIHRLTLWWGDRMLRTHRPLEEKMTLFWHNHFATSNQKVRDHQKMLGQNELFRRQATGNFGILLRYVARDPAMLIYLDNRANRRQAPNENFARELLELFTMGEGHYGEEDIKAAARAFTGWTIRDERFRYLERLHDGGTKAFLGHAGAYNGDDIISLILAHPRTAEFIAGEIYRAFVREDLPEDLRRQLGAVLSEAHYEIKPLLRTIFMSRDFYCEDSRGALIKSPVELVISTYRKIGLAELPTVPDFRDLTRDMGQHLFYPPNVAGWTGGMAWIDPATLLKRANFAQNVLFADDRAALRRQRAQAAARRRAMPPMEQMLAQAVSDGADRQAVQRQMRVWTQSQLEPIPVVLAEVDLSGAAGAHDARRAVDQLCARFLSVPLTDAQCAQLASFLEGQPLDSPVRREAALRRLLHLILSLPEYQLS